MLFGSNSNVNVRKKGASFTERANLALSSLQRNAYAMSVLRSRLEAKVNQALSSPKGAIDSQDLTKMLELVKNGESVLDELSSKVESAKLLEDFIVILDSAAESVREITTDMEKMVPAAEVALQEIHDTILRTTMGTSSEQEIESKNILDDASAASAQQISQELDIKSLTSHKVDPKQLNSRSSQAECSDISESTPEPVPA